MSIHVGKSTAEILKKGYYSKRNQIGTSYSLLGLCERYETPPP